MGWIIDLTHEENGKGVKLKCFKAAREVGGPMEARNGILGRHFKSRFLGITSSLLKLEFLSGFLTSFFRPTQCFS